MVGTTPSTVPQLHRGSRRREVGYFLSVRAGKSWKVVRPHYHSGCDTKYLCEFVLHLRLSVLSKLIVRDGDMSDHLHM